MLRLLDLFLLIRFQEGFGLGSFEITGLSVDRTQPVRFRQKSAIMIHGLLLWIFLLEEIEHAFWELEHAREIKVP